VCRQRPAHEDVGAEADAPLAGWGAKGANAALPRGEGFSTQRQSGARVGALVSGLKAGYANRDQEGGSWKRLLQRQDNTNNNNGCQRRAFITWFMKLGPTFVPRPRRRDVPSGGLWVMELTRAGPAGPVRGGS